MLNVFCFSQKKDKFILFWFSACGGSGLGVYYFSKMAVKSTEKIN